MNIRIEPLRSASVLLLTLGFSSVLIVLINGFELNDHTTLFLGIFCVIGLIVSLWTNFIWSNIKLSKCEHRWINMIDRRFENDPKIIPNEYYCPLCDSYYTDGQYWGGVYGRIPIKGKSPVSEPIIKRTWL